jgi:hypothetical protein
MSYHTFSLVASVENEADYAKLESDFNTWLPDPQIRKIFHPFHGIVAQYDLRNTETEVMTNGFKMCVTQISKLNPALPIACIEVDCFGGKCTSEGEIVQNGEVILVEETDHLAHFKLLKAINENQQTWHFEPFTREYFTKAGGIWGEIAAEKLVYLGLEMFGKYKDLPGYRCDMTENELMLEKKGKFYLYLMEPLENCIKVLGSVLDDSAENVAELQQIIEEHISYTQSYVFIELIDKKERIRLINWDGETKETLYRFRAFNDRPFVFDENQLANQPKKTNTPKSTQPAASDSFWDKLKRIFKGN